MTPLKVDEIDFAVGILEETLRTKRKSFLNERYLPHEKTELVEEIEFLTGSIKQIKEKFEKSY